MEAQFSENQLYNLWWRLHQTRHVLFRVRENELSRYGITSMQAAILLIVKVIRDTEGEATPSKISRWLVREPHTISRICTRMEKDGLVSKTRVSGKKNEVNIILTEKGEQAYRQSSKRESVKEIMSCLSAEELRQLESTLEKLRVKGLDKLNRSIKVPSL
ncbi:MAG: winged helix DNA-binding protein [Chloroflexi bacterium]|nr:winged helix DNA-binding protein [Chloroflexota bacterium]